MISPEGKVYILGVKNKKTLTFRDLKEHLSIEQGTKGDKGDTGEQGIQGIQGLQGLRGEKGDKGDKGDTGLTGPQGPQGVQGAQGIKGDTGNGFSLTKIYTSIAEMNADFSNVTIPENAFVLIHSEDEDNGKLYIKGETEYLFQAQLTGVKGDKGDQGIQGIQGPAGEQGPRGLKGDQGVRGLTGETGPQGPQGLAGIQGIDGVAGPKGDKGDKGDVGPIGLTGPQGPQGEQGVQGLKGDTGPAGPTYELPYASPTTLGGVKIGKRLVVANELLGVAEPDYLLVSRTTDQTINTGDNTIIGNTLQMAKNIGYDINTGIITLVQSKLYRITFNAMFSGGTHQIHIKARTAVTNTNLNNVFMKGSAATTDRSSGTYDIIYRAGAENTIKIDAIGVTATGAKMDSNTMSLVIVEL